VEEHELYEGEETTTFLNICKDGDVFVEVHIFNNGVSLDIPAENFKVVVKELNTAVKMLELHEKNNIKRAA
jgi:hypothetical protein